MPVALPRLFPASAFMEIILLKEKCFKLEWGKKVAFKFENLKMQIMPKKW